MTEDNATATTQDLFLGGKLVIEQPARGFRAGLDAVLLAAAVDAEQGRALKVLDAGAGVGTAGLCVAVRLPQVSVTLVEVAAPLARLARANVRHNWLAERVRVIESDLTGPAADVEASGVDSASFDVVIANPPYLEEGRHRLPEDEVAAGAFGMQTGALKAWLRFMSRAAVGNGRMIMIHRADALGEVLEAIGNRFGGLEVLPVQPRDSEPATRIIVAGRKGSRAPMRLLPALVLHGAGGEFRADVKAMQRDGAGLGRLWLPLGRR